MIDNLYRFRFDGFQQYTVERYAYHANGQPEYIGIAKKGSASSDAKWLITKYTYNGSNQVTLKETSDENAVWDDYNTTVTYS